MPSRTAKNSSHKHIDQLHLSVPSPSLLDTLFKKDTEKTKNNNKPISENDKTVQNHAQKTSFQQQKNQKLTVSQQMLPRLS